MRDRRAAFERFGRSDGYVDDAVWGARLASLGYDSLQLLHGPFGLPEMLLATPFCLNQSAPLGMCPPPEVELRTGTSAQLPCACRELRHSAILNCGPAGPSWPSNRSARIEPQAAIVARLILTRAQRSERAGPQ